MDNGLGYSVERTDGYMAIFTDFDVNLAVGIVEGTRVLEVLVGSASVVDEEENDFPTRVRLAREVGLPLRLAVLQGYHSWQPDSSDDPLEAIHSVVAEYSLQIMEAPIMASLSGRPFDVEEHVQLYVQVKGKNSQIIAIEKYVRLLKEVGEGMRDSGEGELTEIDVKSLLELVVNELGIQQDGLPEVERIIGRKVF
jgi:hypothetical protein